MPRTAQSPVDKVPTKLRQGGRQATKPQPPRAAKRGANADGDIKAARRGISTTTKHTAALVDPNKPLTEMQKLFVKFWAQGESITSASHRAGYSDNATFAYRMVAMPNILALYNAEKRAYEEASGMSRKKVMDMLLDAYTDAKMMSEPASMVSAAREIGKMCGYYEPVRHKVDVSINGNVTMRHLAAMSDADLLTLITENTEAIEG